jgi:organic radical activating enzyme
LIHEGVTELIQGLIARHFPVCIETNGTQKLDPILAYFNSNQLYITVSPKTSTDKMVIQRIHCLKVLFPYLEGCWPEDFARLDDTRLDGAVLCIQPIAPTAEDLTPLQKLEEYSHCCLQASKEVLARPRWRLMPQLHKFINVR